MKYLTLLVSLLILPAVMAEINTFDGGTLEVNYPETANAGEEILITYTLSLEDNSVDILRIGEGFPSEELLNCKGFSVCTGEFLYEMRDEPVTFMLLISLENEIAGEEIDINTESEFVFEINAISTPFINKRFTILPSEPQVEVVDTTPYLNDEIVDKLNELGYREITKEQYLQEVELGKDLLVTKNVDFKKREIESGTDVISVWTIRVELKDGVKSAKNVYIFEDVPKEGAATNDEILSTSHKFSVLRRDPLIMWHFEEVKEPVEITYETDKVGITGAATSVTAEEIDRGTVWHIIIPILVIPIIAFMLIFFGKYRNK